MPVEESPRDHRLDGSVRWPWTSESAWDSQVVQGSPGWVTNDVADLFLLDDDEVDKMVAAGAVVDVQVPANGTSHPASVDQVPVTRNSPMPRHDVSSLCVLVRG